MNVRSVEVTKEEFKGNVAMALTLLQVGIPEAVPLTIEEVESSYMIHADTANTQEFEKIYPLPLEERLRYLINVGKLFTSLEASVYTYSLSPENVVFTQDGIAKIVFRGIKGQVPPYEGLSEDEFLKQYKSMIVATLDSKSKFTELSQGKLEFYKGHKFCEEIIAAQSISEVLEKMQEHLDYERERVAKEMVRVPQRKLFVWKLVGILSGVIAVVLAAVLAFNLFVVQPKQTQIANLRLSFIEKDYSQVVTNVKSIDSKSLSAEDKYIVAYSVIMTESLTNEQKEVLGKITAQTNEDYLRYWVLIGQNKVDEAMDIASYLDDPQLLMYSLTKKIDDVQRDPNLTSEKRTEEINRYKGKLEELKKQYLPAQQKTKEN